MQTNDMLGSIYMTCFYAGFFNMLNFLCVLAIQWCFGCLKSQLLKTGFKVEVFENAIIIVSM